MTKATVNTTSDLAESKIIARTAWTPLTQMPFGRGPLVREMKKQYNVTGAGCYQLALKSDLPIEDLIHKNIGYTGLASDVFSRCGGIPNGRHQAGKMIALQNFKHDDVVIRFLFTDPNDTAYLETAIHNESFMKFGYTFKWRKASGGVDGIATRIITDIDKVDNPAELKNIIVKAKTRFADLILDAAINGSMTDMVNDYFNEEEGV